MHDSPSFFEPLEDPLSQRGAARALGEVTTALRKRLPDHSDLCTMLESMSEFATAARKTLQWTKDSMLTQELQLVVSKMLRLPRHDILDICDDGVALHEVLRVASLLFLSGPCTKLAGNKNGNTILCYHQGRLPMLLRSHELDWTGLKDLELWVLVINGLVETGQDQEWVLGQINHTILVRGLTWDDVLGAVARVAWTDGLWTRTVDQLRVELEQI